MSDLEDAVLKLADEICKFFNRKTIINKTNMLAFNRIINSAIFLVYVENQNIHIYSTKTGLSYSYNKNNIEPYLEHLMTLAGDNTN